MKTMSPLHAAQQLTRVADRFDEWRQTERTLCHSIPAANNAHGPPLHLAPSGHRRSTVTVG